MIKITYKTTLVKEIPKTDLLAMTLIICGNLITAPPMTKPYPMILIAVFDIEKEVPF